VSADVPYLTPQERRRARQIERQTPGLRPLAVVADETETPEPTR
jgi:hypothetical protein